MAAEQRGGRPQNLILESRKRLSVGGVEEVMGFDESCVRMRTSLGELLVQGAELHLEALSVETGEALVTGCIDAFSYEEPARGGLLSRLFGTDGNRPV